MATTTTIQQIIKIITKCYPCFDHWLNTITSFFHINYKQDAKSWSGDSRFESWQGHFFLLFLFLFLSWSGSILNCSSKQPLVLSYVPIMYLPFFPKIPFLPERELPHRVQNLMCFTPQVTRVGVWPEAGLKRTSNIRSPCPLTEARTLPHLQSQTLRVW